MGFREPTVEDEEALAARSAEEPVPAGEDGLLSPLMRTAVA